MKMPAVKKAKIRARYGARTAGNDDRVRHHTHHEFMRASFTAIIASLVFGLTAIAEPIDSQKGRRAFGRGCLKNMRCTNSAAPDGSFTERGGVYPSGAHETHTRWLGHGRLKMDDLLSLSQATATRQHQCREAIAGRFLSQTPNEFVVSLQASTNKTVWQRVSPVMPN